MIPSVLLIELNTGHLHDSLCYNLLLVGIVEENRKAKKEQHVDFKAF